jgi:hypothetical protein
VLAAWLAWLLPAPLARADDDATAKKHFAVAQRLYDDGRHGDALPLFEQALEATGSPNARLYVARCLRELDRLVEAHDQMRRTLDDAQARAREETKYARTRDAAAAELVQIEALVGRVVVALAGDVEGASLKVAGEPVAAIGAPVTVMPGEIAVEASAPGREPAHKTVEVAAGALVTVALSLAPIDEGDESEPPPTSNVVDAPAQDEDFGAVRAAGIAVLGLGAAGMVVFAVTAVMAQERADQLEAECGGARCTDPSKADLVDEGKLLRDVANASLAVGGAALVAGLFMVIFGGPSQAEASATLEHRPGGAVVTVRGRF